MKNKKYSIKYSPFELNYKIIFGKKCPCCTIDEVSKHNKTSDAWVVVDNYVIDVTNFIDDHPGGADLLLDKLGTDVSYIWHKYHHSNVIKDWFPKLIVAYLK